MQSEQSKVTPTLQHAAGAGLRGQRQATGHRRRREADLLDVHQEGRRQGPRRRNSCACSTGSPRRSAPRSGSCASTAWRASTSRAVPTAARCRPTWVTRKSARSTTSSSGASRPWSKTADVPNYVQDLISYSNATVKYLEKDLTAGIKLELPANYSKAIQPAEDKILDVLRGRRPLSDLDADHQGVAYHGRRRGPGVPRKKRCRTTVGELVVRLEPGRASRRPARRCLRAGCGGTGRCWS